jgi:hypothetical protein
VAGPGDRPRWQAQVTGLGDRPRPIVVKFLRFKDMVAVLEKAKNVRGTYSAFRIFFLNTLFPHFLALQPYSKMD